MCALLPSLAVTSLSRTTGVRPSDTAPSVDNCLATRTKNETVVIILVARAGFHPRQPYSRALVSTLAQTASKSVGPKGRHQHRFGPASVRTGIDSYLFPTIFAGCAGELHSSCHLHFHPPLTSYPSDSVRKSCFGVTHGGARRRRKKRIFRRSR